MYLIGFVLLGVAGLSLVRWGHHTPDSVQYLRLAGSLCDGSAGAQLRAPFAYRLLAPAIACVVPTAHLDDAFAMVNVTFTIASGWVILLLARTVGVSRGGLATCAVLYSLSFPVLNYSSGVLSDPSGLLFYSLCLLLVARAQWVWALTAVAVGMLARETVGIAAGVAILVLVLGHRDRGKVRWLWCLGFLIAPLVGLLITREFIGPLPASDASPSMVRLGRNLLRPVSWATVSLTVFPLLAVVVARRGAVADYLRGLNAAPRVLLFSGGLGVLFIFVAGVLSAFMSGRFLWPGYAVLVPCAAQGLRGTVWERLACKVVYGEFVRRHC